MRLSRSVLNCFVFALALQLAACANQMEPAKKALADISVALDSVSADAKKYVPDQLSGVQEKVAYLKAAFDKKDYATVLSGAPPLLAEVQGLAGAAAAKKAEIAKALSDEWTGLAASVPHSIESVRTRVEALSRAKRIPKGIDLTAARSGLEDATAEWGKAQAAFNSGNLADAVTAAKDAKVTAESAAAAIKLQLPDTGK